MSPSRYPAAKMFSFRNRNSEFSTENPGDFVVTCTRPRFIQVLQPKWISQRNRWKGKKLLSREDRCTSQLNQAASIVYCYPLCGEASCGLIFRVRASCTNSLKWRSMPLLWGLICQVHRSTLIEAARSDPTGRRQPADNPTIDRDLGTRSR